MFEMFKIKIVISNSREIFFSDGRKDGRTELKRYNLTSSKWVYNYVQQIINRRFSFATSAETLQRKTYIQILFHVDFSSSWEELKKQHCQCWVKCC